MPKSKSKQCILERKIKIFSTLPDQAVTHKDLEVNDVRSQVHELTISTLNSIAAIFPKIIQTILLHLPYSSHKSVRSSSKALQQAVDQYIGMSITISENHTDAYIANNIQIVSKELLNSFKYMGIRRLKGIQLLKSNFLDIIVFPYLLQTIDLFGQIEHQILLGLLRECWNLRTIKLLEPNQFQTLVRGNFIDFMCSVGTLIEKRGPIRLKHLKSLKIQCSTTSTMGYMLVILSVLEAKNLTSFQCCMGPVHANFYALITGLITNVISTAYKTLKDFWLVVESCDAYPEITAKRRFLRKLTIFHEDFPQSLPIFEDTFKKLYLTDNERDDWLKDILSRCGAKAMSVSKIRLDIDTMEDFTNNWVHFLRHQHCLTTLEVQACCHWSLVTGIVKQNSKTLKTLGLIMEFHSPIDVESLLGDCHNLKQLILKNFDFDWMSPEQLEMRRTGHVVNAKFDELFPNLEHLALSNILIRSSELSRVTRMHKLRDFVLSILEIDAENADLTDPDSMFGLLQEDFRTLLHHRNLNNIVVSREAIVHCGTDSQRVHEMDKLEGMLEDPMFHTTNILGWQLLRVDEEHIAVAHGNTVNMSDWIYPLIMSVIEDTIEADAISMRSLIIDDDDM